MGAFASGDVDNRPAGSRLRSRRYHCARLQATPVLFEHNLFQIGDNDAVTRRQHTS